jgi:hypothetical protein
MYVIVSMRTYVCKNLQTINPLDSPHAVLGHVGELFLLLFHVHLGFSKNIIFQNWTLYFLPVVLSWRSYIYVCILSEWLVNRTKFHLTLTFQNTSSYHNISLYTTLFTWFRSHKSMQNYVGNFHYDTRKTRFGELYLVFINPLF